MKRAFYFIFAGLTLLCCFVTKGHVAAAEESWGRSYLPDVPVVTQDGKTLKFYSDVIKDKIVVISFIYTTCRDICPLVTARLTDIQERLGEAFGRDIFFVSISIDPKTDTPERMKEHADAFGAGKGWLFLTGTPEDIELIRYKLGERSNKLTEHRSEILLRNDRTGEWAKDSAFGDMETVTSNIRAMDPVWRSSQKPGGASGSMSEAAIGGFPGQALYIRACGGCHTIGKGDKVGPDLKGVSTRRTRDWLNAFLKNPEAVHASNDPVALELRAKFKSVKMPNLGLAKADIADLITYIEAQSHAQTLAAKDGDAHVHPQPKADGGENQGHEHHH